jgi:hypothetical protein
MPSDALLSQTPLGVQTATWHSAGVTLGKARIATMLFLRVTYSGAANASGANSWTLTSEISLDGGGTWSTMSGVPPIALSTTAQASEVFLELDLNSPLINPFMSNAPIVRATGTLAGAGSGATINVLAVEVVSAWS